MVLDLTFFWISAWFESINPNSVQPLQPIQSHFKTRNCPILPPLVVCAFWVKAATLTPIANQHGTPCNCRCFLSHHCTAFLWCCTCCVKLIQNLLPKICFFRSNLQFPLRRNFAALAVSSTFDLVPSCVFQETMDFPSIAMDPGRYTLNSTALYIRAGDPTAAQIDINHELPTQSSVQDAKQPSHGITRFFASSSLFYSVILSCLTSHLLTWIMTSCLPVMAKFFLPVTYKSTCLLWPHLSHCT